MKLTDFAVSWIILHGFIDRYSLEEEQLVVNTLKTGKCQLVHVEILTF